MRRSDPGAKGAIRGVAERVDGALAEVGSQEFCGGLLVARSTRARRIARTPRVGPKVVRRAQDPVEASILLGGRVQSQALDDG